MDRLHNWLRDHLNQSKTLHVSQDLLNVCRLAQYWSYCQHDPHRCRLTNPGSKSKFIQKELLQHACLQSYQWTLGIQRILPRRPPSKVQDLMKTLKELDHIQLCRIRYLGYEYSRHCLLDRWKISLGGKFLWKTSIIVISFFMMEMLKRVRWLALAPFMSVMITMPLMSNWSEHFCLRKDYSVNF